jgi:hypothetical protein
MGYDEWLKVRKAVHVNIFLNFKSFDEFTFCRIPKITYGGYIGNLFIFPEGGNSEWFTPFCFMKRKGAN